jgi:hypothetical protein
VRDREFTSSTTFLLLAVGFQKKEESSCWFMRKKWCFYCNSKERKRERKLALLVFFMFKEEAIGMNLPRVSATVQKKRTKEKREEHREFLLGERTRERRRKKGLMHET